MKSTGIGKILGLMLLSRIFLVGMVIGLPSDTAKQKPPSFILPGVSAAYPFIKSSLNEVYAPDAENMQRFYQTLDSLQNGTRQKVNIVHIGDSHIQADIFSGRMRSLLQNDSLFGNGGRGLIFPYPLAKTNNPWNYKVSYTGQWKGCRNIQSTQDCAWGLAGIVAETSDSAATFTINTGSQTGGTRINRAKVFVPVSDLTNYSIVIQKPDSGFIPGRLDAAGFVEFLLPQEVLEVTFVMQKTAFSQSHFTLQGVSLENDKAGIQYTSLGINGAEVSSFLRCSYLEAHLKTMKPDLIIISLGTNDSYGVNFNADAFFINYGTLLQRMHRAAPSASFLLTTPGDNFRKRKYANTNTVKAVGKMYELAEQTGFSLWNFYHIMGGLRSSAKWQAAGLAASDRVHLTGKGYRLQGDLLYNALMKDYLKWKERK